MIRYECDRCGARLSANDPHRFIVKIEVYAAAGPIELTTETLSDTRAAIEDVIHELSQADPDEIEDQTYRCLQFDVCDDCRRALLAKPI